MNRSSYFQTSNTGIKEKYTFREHLKLCESKERTRAEQRCREIWNEFLTEDQTCSVDRLRYLKFNLHIKIDKLNDSFIDSNYSITLQLMNMPDRSFMPQIEI